MKLRHLLFSCMFALSAAGQSLEEPVPLREVNGAPLQWRDTEDEPVWLGNPKRAEGRFAFSTIRRGSNQQIAMVRATSLCEGDVRRVFAEHLTPVLGADVAGEVVEQLLPHVVCVEAATTATRRIPGARGPGQTVGATFLHWHLPVGKALAQVSPELRGRIEWVLLRDVVRWEQLDAPPAWFAAPPTRAGYVRVSLRTLGELPRKTREQALAQVRTRVHERLLARLAPVVGYRLAAAAADRGVNRIAAVRRADWLRRPWPLDGRRPDTRITTVWGLWEVPIAAMLEALPAEMRDGARKACAGTGSAAGGR